MPAAIPVVFAGGNTGAWVVAKMAAVRGEGLPAVRRVMVQEGGPLASADAGAAWYLRGTTGHVRYVERAEKAALAQVTPPLGRTEAMQAALIPIRKSEAWWDLAQDERRAILEEHSGHIALGMQYLPAIARRLYHCRELGEPFDFLTWFEFAPEHAPRFDDLLGALRSSEEWRYVDREVEIRLQR